MKGDLDATGERVVIVPRDLSTREELLDALAHGLRFPSWFGHNWDALYDCLCDLSGVEEPRVILVHTDMPLTDPKDRAAYIDLLRDAVASWNNTPDRELVVVFPLDAPGPKW